MKFRKQWINRKAIMSHMYDYDSDLYYTVRELYEVWVCITRDADNLNVELMELPKGWMFV